MNQSEHIYGNRNSTNKGTVFFNLKQLMGKYIEYSKCY